MRIISGLYKNRTLKAPKGSNTRPTSEQLREAVFNICQGYIEGASFLDLFAGSGAMGIEALSRGAARSVFIDSDKTSIFAIKENINNFSLEEVTSVYAGDVLSWIERLSKKGQTFDIIYADPPYASKGNESQNQLLLELIDSTEILKPAGELFLEESCKMLLRHDELQTLQLIQKRTFGKSCLHQFRSKKKDKQDEQDRSMIGKI